MLDTTKCYSLSDVDLHYRSEGYGKARTCVIIVKWHEVAQMFVMVLLSSSLETPRFAIYVSRKVLTQETRQRCHFKLLGTGEYISIKFAKSRK